MTDQSPVFLGLTKPVTWLGVDYHYFLLSSLFVVLLFVYSESFLSILFYLPLHISGVLLMKMDPYVFKLLSLRASIGRTKHHRYWGCQSYESI